MPRGDWTYYAGYVLPGSDERKALGLTGFHPGWGDLLTIDGVDYVIDGVAYAGEVRANGRDSIYQVTYYLANQATEADL